jgi:hypothetical protein
LAGGINQYGYAGGDPVNHSDPFGLFPGIRLNTASAVVSMKRQQDESTLEVIGNSMLGTLEMLRTEIVGGAAVRAASAATGSTLFRSGKANPGNLRPRAGESGVSVRTSLSNPIDSKDAPVFRPGGDVTEIDATRLPAGSVRVDNVPEGHAEIQGLTPEQVKAAVVNTKKLP